MSPGESLKEFITSYIKQKQLDEYLIKEIPKKWEKYGDFVLFDERTFCNEIWKSREEEFWIKVSQILKCKRIGVKNRIQNDAFRTPNVSILLGSDSWIVHKDNSIIYSWNVEKSMFSAGNACERHRIANLNCENEVVVDLFAGIGYFSLPFLVHAKAAFLHACEWNPAAVVALKKNLVLNKVDHKCIVYEGDNRLMCPKKVANRVNLGLIPSSKDHWKTACEALVDNGGVLHVHENVETKKIEISCADCTHIISKLDKEVSTNSLSMDSRNMCINLEAIDIFWKHKQWVLKGIHILHSLISILSNVDEAKVWYCSIENINYVKSYAPHVHHLVYDIKVKDITLEKF